MTMSNFATTSHDLEGEGELPLTPYNQRNDYVCLGPQYTPDRGLVRYSDALKHLIPIRRKNKKKNLLKIDDAGFFSFVTYSWMTKYIWQGYRRGLSIEDIPIGSPLDAGDFNAQRLELLWENEVLTQGKVNASFGRVVWKFARTRLLIAALTFSISCFMGFLSPTIFMRKLLEFSESEDSSWKEGIIWAVALASSELLRTLFFCMCWSISYRTATRLRAACLTLVYRKILTLYSLGQKSSGEMINMFANDGPRLFYMIVFGPMIIGGPLVAACGVAYILSVLGPWALLGMLTFILFYPVQFGLSHLSGYFRSNAIKLADERVKIMTEVLTYIKLIKMYTWETAFGSRIQATRRQEVSQLKKIAYCQSLGIILAPTVPIISGIVTFAAHILSGGNLTASQAFPVLTFTSKQLRMALKHLRESCNALQEGLVAIPRFKAFPLVTILTSQLRAAMMNVKYGTENIKIGSLVFARIQDLLLMESLQVVTSNPKNEEDALVMEECCFVVGSQVQQEEDSTKNNAEKQKLNEPEPTDGHVLLADISFTVRKSQLVGICGAVGSGKSSILLACMGQLKMTGGDLYRQGSLAYVSQEAWIQNASLKENIIFGELFDPKRYIQMLHCCALNEDVHLLPGGDETEIGERGINLSGGQKQRVALARALYSNRDIYLLDDPLSAVDAEVGAHIMEEAILGELRGKTVLLVTHQVSHLARCDNVLVLKSGRLVGQGSHNTLLEQSSDYRLIVQATEFSEVTLTERAGTESDLRMSSSSLPSSPVKAVKPEGNRVATIVAEEQLRGGVKGYAYTAYMNACGGPLVCSFVLFTVFINSGINAFSSYWLALWIRQGGGNVTVFNEAINATIKSERLSDNPDLNWYMSIYIGIIGLIIASSIIRSLAVTHISVRAGRILHDCLYAATTASPLRYFESTPMGRILNLFARDLDEVESRLPVLLETLVQNIWVVVFAFLFITLIFHWFLLALIILAALYYYVSKIFRVAIRDLQRMENISRAPVLSAVSATIQGLPTIHAFQKEKKFLCNFAKCFDDNSTCLFMNCNAMRWMATRLDSISVIITCIIAFLVILLKGQVPAALAGLALTYAVQISGVFQYTIRLMSESESRFISVERIQSTIKSLVPEGEDNNELPPSGWPSKGAIKFKDVLLSYGENLPPVLNSFSLSVRAGEKLGVVGRTGAGKSSLIVALFRLCELSSGTIYIDGVDISKLDLKALRRVMAVIPQDPVLFNGTLRYNLDPFNEHSDEKLWSTVNKTQLEGKVRSMEGGLNATVGDGGDSLSVGERQLLCLARALLRGCKILLLDEATASVDPETEQTIQQTIRTEFASSTVITIAHRLATVTSTNRVLLMDHGAVVELDDPSVLLANRNSQFAHLAAAVGFIPSNNS